MENEGCLIAGQWVPSADHRADINPSNTGDVIGMFAIGGAVEVDAAAQAAAQALPAWAAAPPQARAAVLDAVADQLTAQQSRLGELLAREEGKTRPEAEAEVARAAQIFRFFAGEAVRLVGDVQASYRPGVRVTQEREPVGVVGIITPWNFPIAIPAWKSAPALAYGNTVVLKPADLVPATAVELAKIMTAAGAPPGIFNLVTGPGSSVGTAIAEHPLIDAVTFTGSEAVGRQVLATASARFARVQLELGGKNPMVIAADADLDTAVECCVAGAFFSTGQRCTASSRLIVEDAIYEPFLDRLLERTKALTVGDALSAGIDIGPVVDERQLATDQRYLELARSDHRAAVYGGELVTAATPGHFLRPAVIAGLDNSAVINREEIFGPIAGVIRVADYEEAVAVANDTDYGLVAGICTTSLSHAEDFRRRAQAGMVMVNLPTAGVDPHVAFGGRRRSGYGPKEQGSQAREFFTQLKVGYTAS
ncbi:MAG: aldehyde dehydrogenase family protein [Nostocoides sp.]